MNRISNVILKTAMVSGLATLSFGAVLNNTSVNFMHEANISANSYTGYSNGRYIVNGNWANGYYHDGTNWYLYKDGVKQSQIQYYMGGYYYFDPQTYLRTDNAFRDEWGNTYYFGNDGRAVTGYQSINGKQYYFGDDGTYTLRKSQWLQRNNNRYYATSDGSFAADVTNIGGTYYYFNPNTNALNTQRNYIQARWGSWYLVGSNGQVLSGLQSWAGHQYYFDPSTYLKVVNDTVNINGQYWHFDDSGIGSIVANPTTPSNPNNENQGGQNYIGDDYPAQWKTAPQDSVFDNWGMYNRECTSFVANRLHAVNGFDISRSGLDWNACNWGTNARKQGYTVDNNPRRGSIAWWRNGYHVAWVASVNGSNVNIEEYNYNYSGSYHTRTINRTSPDGYIHFKDLN